MIKMVTRFINWFLNKIYPNNDEEIEFSEAVKLEQVYNEIPSIMGMKNYKKPHVGQKFYCRYESEMYVYIGGGKFVCMTDAYI